MAMRKVLLIAAVLLWFAGVASFVYWFWPREQHFTVTHLVPEKFVKTMTYEIRIGEQTGTVAIPFQYEVHKPVHETLTKEPTREAQLRFFCLAGVASLVFLYCAIVILSFGRCLWNGTAPAKSLELQLTGTVTFLMGIFGGAIALPTSPQVIEAPKTYTNTGPEPYYPPVYSPAPTPVPPSAFDPGEPTDVPRIEER